jgi:prevent-host-death family protein
MCYGHQVKTATIQEVKDHLSQYVRLAEAGEEVLLTRHGIVVARIVGCAPARQLGWMKGTIEGDLDGDLEGGSDSEGPDDPTNDAFYTDNVIPR